MASSAEVGQPEPVLKAQAVTVAAAVIGMLVAFGVHVSDEQRLGILSIVGTVVPLLALAAAWWSRKNVTPVSRPRDADGQPLVRVDGQPLTAHRPGRS